ncbi:MAG: hypothetical protein HW412_1293 [Bacteroidetes bacterium]|nr:hypothetical protein [Bacteroidota bacterium]
MAAQDTFESFNASLRSEDRKRVSHLMKTKSEEMLAARSEEASVRLVHDYIKEVHDLFRIEK